MRDLFCILFVLRTQDRSKEPLGSWPMIESNTFLRYESEMDFTFLDGARDENDFKHFVENSQTDDLTDAAVMYRPNYDEMEQMGHQLPNFIFNCTFDGVSCPFDDFYVIPNRQFGMCVCLSILAT